MRSSSWPSPWPSPAPCVWPWAGPKCSASPPTSWRSDMNVATIAIALCLIVFVLARRVRGEAVPAPKKLFLLPIVLGAIGLDNISHTKLNSVDIAVIAIGSLVSLGLGLLRGRMDKLSIVNGSPFVSWTAGSVVVFVVNVVAKLALDAGGVAA